MDDTLEDGEWLYVDMTEYGSIWQTNPNDSNNAAERAPRQTYGTPNHFDIVACRFPLRGEVNFVKQIVGMPGDYISIREMGL